MTLRRRLPMYIAGVAATLRRAGFLWAPRTPALPTPAVPEFTSQRLAAALIIVTDGHASHDDLALQLRYLDVLLVR